MPLKIYSYT